MMTYEAIVKCRSHLDDRGTVVASGMSCGLAFGAMFLPVVGYGISRNPDTGEVFYLLEGLPEKPVVGSNVRIRISLAT